jgi:putative ATP-dependent endonuclease of OLD family
MFISHAQIENFRALQTISIPLNKFSVLLGENDVGKTSFLYSLDAFFKNKKISDQECYFKKEINNPIKVVLTFEDIPDDEKISQIKRKDGTIIISRVFSFDQTPITKIIADDNSENSISATILNIWFSSDNFHFIPVRRDLSVQFSMTKTALLGKTLRAKMRNTIDSGNANESLQNLQNTLQESLKDPQDKLQNYLREQLHNEELKLSFEDIAVDPLEGVSFSVKLSDECVEDILINNRGAGTQNNLIIALFRFIASINLDNYFILAMEEPENSLHPKAQRQLLSVLQQISSVSQVIVTTHSPVFLERSKFENNIILTRTVKGNTIAKTFNIELLDQLRIDLGIRPSDALLKGGGNCAILVEGNTEEEGFPVFMEMLGLSEFQLGIAIINMRGSDYARWSNTARLLHAYDIPCIAVLDNDAEKTADDLQREAKASLPNIKRIFRLNKGNIEDYFPLEIVADVINQELKPITPVSKGDFDADKHGEDRIRNFEKIMKEHGAGEAKGYLKKMLGLVGTKMMKERDIKLDPEVIEIFEEVKRIVDEQ